jgi:hypothetical protein
MSYFKSPSITAYAHQYTHTQTALHTLQPPASPLVEPPEATMVTTATISTDKQYAHTHITPKIQWGVCLCICAVVMYVSSSSVDAARIHTHYVHASLFLSHTHPSSIFSFFKLPHPTNTNNNTPLLFISHSMCYCTCPCVVRH